MTENNSTAETTPAEEGRQPEAPKRALTEAVTRRHQREQALVLANDLAKAHTDLTEPGTFAIVWADHFAAFLATGALPPELAAAKRKAAEAFQADQGEQ